MHIANSIIVLPAKTPQRVTLPAYLLCILKEEE
jgi:hypothetical protein